MSSATRELRAAPADALRRAVRVNGPWPRARTFRGVAATLLAVAVAVWATTAEPLLGGLLALPALAGLGVLAAALASGRTRRLPLALTLLALPVALAVSAVDPPAGTVAGLGAALVAVLELARWSIERRIDPPTEGATELRRWAHLLAVLALGWLGGVSVVVVAAGRIDLAVWQAVVAALAIVTVAGAVGMAARSRV